MRAPGVHGKRGLERGWQKRLAKGWRKVGEGSAKRRRRVGGFPCTLSNVAIPEAPVQKNGFLTKSEAWGPPQFQEKRSRSERAILGALGEFRGILGAALGIGNSILGIRNSILGMASHDLINTKPTILGATLGAIPGIAANPPERFSFAPAFSERFFKNWGGPRAPEAYFTPHPPGPTLI